MHLFSRANAGVLYGFGIRLAALRTDFSRRVRGTSALVKEGERRCGRIRGSSG